MKWIGHFLFISLYALVTLFGLGPVLLADGTNQERTMTAIVVLIFYGVVTFGYLHFIKWTKRNSR